MITLSRRELRDRLREEYDAGFVVGLKLGAAIVFIAVAAIAIWNS